MKTTTIHEQVFLHHQCTHTESRCYKVFLFQRYLSFLYPQGKAPRHTGCILPHPPHHRLRQLIVFRNNDVFLLVFGIKYIKHLCNNCSENPMLIFMTHICQVNDCEPIIIDLNTLWVLHPLTFKYRDLYRHSIIQFSYFCNIVIISIFCPVLYSASTLTPLF
jgi:hypothetical protein